MLRAVATIALIFAAVIGVLTWGQNYEYSDRLVELTRHNEQLKTANRDLQRDLVLLQADFKSVRSDLAVANNMINFQRDSLSAAEEEKASLKRQYTSASGEMRRAIDISQSAASKISNLELSLEQARRDYAYVKRAYDNIQQLWAGSANAALWEEGRSPTEESILLARHKFDQTMASMEAISQKDGKFYYFGNLGDVAIPMLYHLNKARELQLVTHDEVKARVERLARYVRQDDTKSLQVVAYLRNKLN